MSEGIDEIAIGVLCEALQRHRAAGGIADQAFQLIALLHRGRQGPGEFGRVITQGA